MNVGTMRFIDAWAGVPMCAFSTALRWLASPFRRTPTGRVEDVLFVKLAEQGSTVLAYPALRRAVDAVGAENVYFLVFDENRCILDAMEVIPPENVVAIRTSSILRLFLSTVGALWRLRRLKVDAAIDLEFFARSTTLLTWLSGAKRRVGLHAYAGDGPWRGDLMTHRVQYNAHHHTAQFFDLLVRALEQPPDRFPAFDAQAIPLAELPWGRFRPSSEEVAEARRILETAFGSVDPSRLVLLNANCSDMLPFRKWQEGNYVELGRRLLEAHPSLVIGLTGAPDEAGPVEALGREIASERCVSLAGHTTLRQLLVIYGLAEVLVTNDSGPAHFASLTPIDVVTLFGPETPALFGVVSDRSHILWARTACSPCVSAYNNRVSRCRDNVCMQDIGVDEVFDTVERILASRPVAAEARTGRA